MRNAQNFTQKQGKIIFKCCRADDHLKIVNAKEKINIKRFNKGANILSVFKSDWFLWQKILMELYQVQISLYKIDVEGSFATSEIQTNY